MIRTFVPDFIIDVEFIIQMDEYQIILELMRESLND